MAWKIASVSLLIIFFQIFQSSTGIQLNTQLKTSDVVSNGHNELPRARPLFIMNRDSYLDAASSSYKAPQNSYGAPMQMQGYGGGGHGWSQQEEGGNTKLSKKDILGLVGLLGLLGLKGLVPLIKIVVLWLAALAPILIPISLGLFFLKPVITLGRSLNTIDDNLFPYLDGSNDTHPFGFLEEMLNDSNNETNSTLNHVIKMGAGLFGRELDNQCMERIACEGIFKSIPRIFLRVLGENYSPYKTLRRKRNIPIANEKEQLPRRKDLSTIALNKLKSPNFLTKKSPITENPADHENACKKYKCTTLF